MTHSALPSSLQMKHGAYSMGGKAECRVERRKPICLKKTLCPAFKNKKNTDCVFFDCRVVVHKEFVPKGQTVNQDVCIGILQRSCKSCVQQGSGSSYTTMCGRTGHYPSNFCQYIKSLCCYTRHILLICHPVIFSYTHN